MRSMTTLPAPEWPHKKADIIGPPRETKLPGDQSRVRSTNSTMNGFEQSRYHSAIIESSGDAIYSRDVNGVIQDWNKAAEEIFGYTAEEIIGQPATLIIPPDYLGEELDIFDRICRGERIKRHETI